MTFTIGAIRWDAWYSNDPSAPSFGTAAALSDEEYQFRAPAHAQVLGANRIQWGDPQAALDAEIQFAAAIGGPNFYWNYLLYPLGSPQRLGIDSHIASQFKTLQKFTLMVPTDGMGFWNNFSSTIDEFAARYVNQPHYFFLPSGKPLLYIYYTAGDIAGRWNGSQANLKVAIDYLRNKFVKYLGLRPYTVVMCGADDGTRQALGAEAVGNYISSFPASIDGTYAALDTSTQNYWTTLKNAVQASGGNVVPPGMTGWGSFPRHRRPEAFNASQWTPEHGMRYGFGYPTLTELGNHFAAMKAFVLGNPSLCPEQTGCFYAWNECDEGGWACRTLGDPTGTRLQTIASLL